MFQCLPDSAGANGDLAELAGQLGKMMEHLNQSEPNPGPRPPVSPCIIVAALSEENLNFRNNSWLNLDRLRPTDSSSSLDPRGGRCSEAIGPSPFLNDCGRWHLWAHCIGGPPLHPLMSGAFKTLREETSNITMTRTFGRRPLLAAHARASEVRE